MAAKSQGESVVLPFSSDEFLGLIERAWDHAKPIAISFPRPKNSNVARFSPTDECIVVIRTIIDRYTNEVYFGFSSPLFLFLLIFFLLFLP
jgi:hypothetical protein